MVQSTFTLFLFCLVVSFTKENEMKGHTLNQFVFALATCLMLTSVTYAQHDTIRKKELQQVEVTALRSKAAAIGQNLLSFDSLSLRAYQNRNVADLLADESGLFIKSYGLGSLATTSFRGGSAAHTAVVWNGFNLNSPMNGTIDLALLPVSGFSGISTLGGGNAGVWGSGAVGGVIQLENKAQFAPFRSLASDFSVGSFGNGGITLRYEMGTLNTWLKVTAYGNTATNNFHYTGFDGVMLPQKNADFKRIGLMTDGVFQKKQNRQMGFSVWGQLNERGIPPTLLQAQNQSRQSDAFLRGSFFWKYHSSQWTWQARNGVFWENLTYSDPLYEQRDENQSLTNTTEIETKWRYADNQSLLACVHNSFITVSANGYGPNRHYQHRIALFALWEGAFINNKMNISLNARQEIVNGAPVPTVGALSLEYRPAGILRFYANVNRLYRLPTFNDLYWNPGGNETLKPESGFSQQAGLKKERGKNALGLAFDACLFNRTMQNWIIWLPGVSFWQPQNLQRVWSRGVETDTKLSYQWRKSEIEATLNTRYTLSTNEEKAFAEDKSLHRQLIYVPMYAGWFKLRMRYDRFQAWYRHNYNGYRFTSTDNTQYLQPFEISAVGLSVVQPLKRLSFELTVIAQNVFNTRYQLILSRPMPLRNFSIQLSITHKKQKQT